MIEILTVEKFIKEVEIIKNATGDNYIDSVIHYCEKNNIEIETAASIIKSNPLMVSKLQQDGEKINILPVTAKIPF